MNIINTGQSKSRKDIVEELANQIKTILLGRENRYKDISTSDMLQQDLLRSFKRDCFSRNDRLRPEGAPWAGLH